MIDTRFDDPTLQEFPILQACCCPMLHDDSIQVFSFQKPNTFALASTPQIFFCSLNYLTGPLTNNNEFKHTMSITFQKYNPWCGRLKAYWWNQASMKQDDVQDNVPSTRTLFKSITAESLLVKPGFDEAGRCPIHKNTIQNIKAEGLLVKPDSIKQDDVL